MLTGAGRTQSAEPLVISDMAGRTVRLPALPKRIVLLEAHDMLTMSLLHRDPASLVVGWAATDRIDSDDLTMRLQNGRRIEVVGRQMPETVSLEKLLALEPDLVVTTAFMTPLGAADSLVAQLERSGVAVAFSDASSNTAAVTATADPVTSLKASMQMWGAILGEPEKAKAYVRFVERNLDLIGSRIAGSAPVTTYLEVQSTLDDCCWAAGRRVWGELLALAGGQPLPGVTAPWFEKLLLEYVMATPHDVYIASGGGWSAGGRPSLGPGIDPIMGRQSLQHLVEARPNFEHLSSVRQRRVHAIWTGLITNLPLNILFVAQVGRWLHPERCADLDTAAMLDVINREFAAVRIDGPLWVSL